MIFNQRIIWDDDGTLVDISKELASINGRTKTISYVAADDFIYIGSDLPFNHRYFEVSTANDQATAPTVAMWDGSAWNSAVDVIDWTSDGIGSFEQSGMIQWSKDRTKTWAWQDTTENIPALSTLKIYDFYWLRMSFSGDFNASTALKYVGHKFSTDDDLKQEYPDLIQSKYLTAFQSGKTNWNEQHVVAAEDIVLYLRKKREILSANQVFNWEQFTKAAVHRCAYIIMRPFGDDYAEERSTALKEYHTALNQIHFQVDSDATGRVEREERYTNQVIGLNRR